MFRDRREAGRLLAERLLDHRDDPDVIVLGLPRGGVPVAYEVAMALGAPLDVVVVRKLGVPSRPEVAMGAIGEQGVRYIDDDLIRRIGVADADVQDVERREQRELERRAHRLRTARPGVTLDGRTVIVVDDGAATGSTAQAACRVVRALHARRIVLAVPVAPSDWTKRLQDAADEYVAVETHWRFSSVGLFYRDFAQVSDDEVVELLQAAARERLGEDET